MKGEYLLTISNSILTYKLRLKHGINIIKGDSGTGKTTLYRMAMEVEDKTAGYKSNFADKVVVLIRRMPWESILQNSHGCFIFADETVPYIYSKAFASLAQNSDNYIILITRRNLDCLVYSAYAIYILEANYKDYKNTLINLYEDNPLTSYKPDIILCEDKNSDYEMFCNIFSIPVESAGDKDGIVPYLKQNKDKKVYAIADGEGFGNCVNEIINLRDEGYYFYLYLPKSFEYMVLNYIKFRRSVEDKLLNTENYCDTTEFKSWERFYTYLLEQVCESHNFKYSKSKLTDKLKFKGMYDNIKSQLLDLGEEVMQ